MCHENWKNCIKCLENGCWFLKPTNKSTLCVANRSLVPDGLYGGIYQPGAETYCPQNDDDAEVSTDHASGQSPSSMYIAITILALVCSLTALGIMLIRFCKSLESVNSVRRMACSQMGQWTRQLQKFMTGITDFMRRGCSWDACRDQRRRRRRIRIVNIPIQTSQCPPNTTIQILNPAPTESTPQVQQFILKNVLLGLEAVDTTKSNENQCHYHESVKVNLHVSKQQNSSELTDPTITATPSTSSSAKNPPTAEQQGDKKFELVPKEPMQSLKIRSRGE